MQISLTNTLTRGMGCGLLLGLAACQGEPTRPRAESVAERLALMGEECGFVVSLPASRADIEAIFAQNKANTYVVEAPLGGSSGDNVFPMSETPEFNHGEIASAIVVICPAAGNPMALGSRSPRFAFYIDEHGTAFHVEDHSLYLG